MENIVQVRAHLLPHAFAPDPDHANLRLAARAAVTYSLVFAFAWLVLGSADATLFAAFAVYGLGSLLASSVVLYVWFRRRRYF